MNTDGRHPSLTTFEHYRCLCVLCRLLIYDADVSETGLFFNYKCHVFFFFRIALAMSLSCIPFFSGLYFLLLLVINELQLFVGSSCFSREDDCTSSLLQVCSKGP